MFYSHEILRKKGKFGIVWLAATCKKRVTRRDIWRVNVADSSDDIIEILNRHPVALRRTGPLSLYLSSQLMFGLVYVTSKQYQMLLEDLKSMVIKIASFRVPTTSSIDLEKPVDEAKVTMSPPDMDDVPLEFGCLTTLPEPSNHSWQEFFMVPSPFSPEEDVLTPITPGYPLGRDSFPDDAEMLHRADHGDITMQEIPIDSEEPILEMQEESADFLPGVPFLDQAHEEQIQSGLFPESHHEPVPMAIDENLSHLLTPEAPTALEEFQQLREAIDISQNGEIAQQERNHGEEQRISPAESAETFVLGPIAGPGRRQRRRRHLIIDPVTTLSGQQIQSQIARIDNLTVPIRRPTLLETAESMLRRLSTQFIPIGIRSRINRLQTLSEPTDLFSYVISPPEEVPETEMLRQEETIPSAEEIPAAISLEMRRDETDVTVDPSVSGLLKTSSLKVAGLSSSASPLARNVTGSPVRPMIEEEYIMPSPGTEIPEPEIRSFEETILEKSMPSICKMSPVSPERTPPPSSGESSTVVLDETLQLIFETLEQSGIPDITTFNAVLLNTTQTKKRVATLFSHLLRLHARGLIDIQQPIPGEKVSFIIC
ncbi:rad21_Rec8_N domain-containing protein [Trichonephila clavata]|uniref:Rad21_Rec8_N domain-containing protein n=1 Tax=Trichonephila clavata TaxID=2740835 RepID=A0A8X6IHN8_TRICU|nr:rad21_Rec8_N domain-containing protein [Trichonephila clavata]